jgi:hypothetical protein
MDRHRCAATSGACAEDEILRAQELAAIRPERRSDWLISRIGRVAVTKAISRRQDGIPVWQPAWAVPRHSVASPSRLQTVSFEPTSATRCATAAGGDMNSGARGFPIRAER